MFQRLSYGMRFLPALGFWITLVMAACTPPDPPEPRTPILDIRGFETYVSRFEQAAHGESYPIRVTDLRIKLGTPLTEEHLGSCGEDTDQTPLIIVNSATWGSMSASKREAMLFHEMGHCVLQRSHREDFRDEGVPKSIMNSTLLSDTEYLNWKSYYHEELFYPDRF